jgi:hypothetical protein
MPVKDFVTDRLDGDPALGLLAFRSVSVPVSSGAVQTLARVAVVALTCTDAERRTRVNTRNRN